MINVLWSPFLFFTVYKTTNLINGKFYVGKHKTKVLNDGYMGSGKILKHSMKKYGIDNFKIEYLGVFDSEWKMNVAEKIYVVLDTEVSYNLCPGGHGGFGYINKQGLNKEISVSGRNRLSKFMKIRNLNFDNDLKSKRAKKSAATKKKNNTLNTNTFLGKKHSDKSKMLMSKKSLGQKNSQFGTYWITNGFENKKIKKEELDNYVLLGYYRGRI
jgi:hypothetical protein